MNAYQSLAIKLNEVFQENCEKLCALDVKAGDGDHGITISRGFASAAALAQKLPESATPAEVMRSIGYGMLDVMGGASGPIFSTLFIQAAIVLGDSREMDAKTLLVILDQAIAAITDLTDTQPGEKTMLDALDFAARTLRKSGAATLADALSAVVQGAREGAQATVDMVATKGRAKFLGERSRGFVDAGSQSCVLIFEAMLQTLS